MVYEFNKCNSIGKNGEFLIQETMSSDFILTDGYSGDLIYKGEKFELKTDTYKSGNFFFEEISNVRLYNKGGVWQSKEHGCKYYSYYMLKYDKLYIFDVDIILEWLNANKNNYKQRTVYNTTKTSLGYAIPIKDTEHLCIDVINLNELNMYNDIKLKYFPNFSKN